MTTETQTFDELLSDVFDIRAVIERFEELEAERDDAAPESALKAYDESEEGREYAAIAAFLGEVCGNGGDEQWRGGWYPVTFIRDSYFEEYAQELAEDWGMINRDARWPNNCIDWELAAGELQQDYSSVDIHGITYWYR